MYLILPHFSKLLREILNEHQRMKEMGEDSNQIFQNEFLKEACKSIL